MSARAICPGTFDPVHYGHIDIFQRAASIFENVIVAVYDQGNKTKQPLFSIEERLALINANIDHLPNVSAAAYSGMTADFAKSVDAHVIVRGLRVFSDFEFEFRMALTTDRIAPGIEYVTLMTKEDHMFLSGTTVREIASLAGDISSMVPHNVAAALHKKYGN